MLKDYCKNKGWFGYGKEKIVKLDSRIGGHIGFLIDCRLKR